MTLQRPLGVALIGYAFMGRAHSNAWRQVSAAFDVPAFERRVIVGRDPELVAEAAGRLGWAEWATDWRTVLERDDIDIVDICTPGNLHAEIAIAALAAGKHVLVEKPLANTLAEAEEMADAAAVAERDGIRSMVGFNYRRVPALALARRLVAEGRVGDIRQVRVSYLQDWLTDADAPMSWRLRRETAGSGALGDLASHAVDQLQFLLGEPVTRVSATTNTFVPTRPGPHGIEAVTVDDAVWATLSFGSGAMGSLEVSRVATGQKNALSVELYGSAGALRFDLEQINELWFLDATEPIETQGFRRILVTEPEHPYVDAWWPQGHVLGWEHSFVHELRDLLVGIADGTPVRPSFAEGLSVQRVLAAIVASADDAGRTVDIASINSEESP
ncbi:Gfo/Idh/MocA family protein [Lacisediminihabitans changchengi]|uniref:Gfo/Idh/MocA family oxidoreductase n=1 Tax=Lacisediminihabitans changchengi TaxID=2787634 RepID=A0A934VZF4_9MICO|nr:Gfo/Idh/MocA family oxidoreductase [Lacisediminihabitans changchengi]MBK4349097.1 Gfo/Idh/MocA family oxidoreductase [Lacisediminihabitans changchengi]